MKYLWAFALMGLWGIANIGYSQEIPDGLKGIMEQLQNDPDVAYGFNFAKKHGFIDHDVAFDRWSIGTPIEIFKLNGNALENADEESEIDDVIEPNDTWIIPILIDMVYIYKVKVLYENGNYKTYGCGEGVLGFHTWDKVRQKYPEDSGVRPVVIGMKHKFIYFPDKKGSKKLFYVKNPKWNDELSRITSNSLDSLDDSKTIINYLKKERKANKEKRRKFFEKNPDIFKNKSGGAK
jgi:hypothetical protein